MISTENKTRTAAHIAHFESTNSLNIDFCVILGSHATGTAHEDSDVDILCVHTEQEKSRYCTLSDRRDKLEMNYENGMFEIESWSVQNLLSLLSESNEMAMHVLFSPIVIRDSLLRYRLKSYMRECYSPIKLYHSYRSKAKNNYLQYIESGNRRTVKKNTFVLIAALKALYIRKHAGNNQCELPHINTKKFLDEQASSVIDDSTFSTANWLINKKTDGDNSTVGDVVGDIALQPTDVTDTFSTEKTCEESKLNEIVNTTI